MRLAWSILLVAAALYAGVCLLAFVLQRRLMYFPDRYPERAAIEVAERLGVEAWRDAQGALVGWRVPAEGAPLARVMVLHGNAGSALDRLPYAAALAPLGVEVWLLEYPGYGPRSGQPSLRSLSEAAVAAARDLAAMGPEPVVLLGESLGSGVAARTAALAPEAVRGLILVTPYARMAEVARIHYPFLPGFLVRDRWSPIDDLAGFRGPVAVLVAGRDEVVTPAQGRELFEALPGPKRLWVQEGATHNGIVFGPAEAEETIGFVTGA